MFNVHFEEDPQNKQVLTQFENLPEYTTKAMRRAYYTIGKHLVAEAKNLINTKPKHGRTYTKYYGTGRIKTLEGIRSKRLVKGKKYIASAPYEAPAVVTGFLRDSINFTVNGGGSEMEFGVDTSRRGVKYGEYLEFENLVAQTGWGSPKIVPRPFISRAYENKRRDIEQAFVDEFNKFLK